MVTLRIDMLGLKCPRPVFELHKSMKTMAVGSIVEVLADDPAFVPDVRAWCARTGHAIKSLRTDDERILVQVQKTRP